ncbi:hypothetical protein [Oceanicoccus sp. KOV_DT_Chl]|uniref:hypothetical protein n=1 Tax=Oceanicoccus sp. KOV_DT_Chl TaxID=1904639 RepID=UPI000C7A161D|nr:hypothetical protein [Oceanicoccus sp. KOV_DT_Chl]
MAGVHPYENTFATDVLELKLKPTFKQPIKWLYRRLITNAIAVKREQRTQSASQFLSSLQWAVNGPRRVLIGGTLVLVLIIANTFLIEAVDDDIPLSELPIEQQQKVLTYIAEADTALKFQDYNGALVYLDRAYKIHNSNDDVEDRSDQILKFFSQQLKKAPSSDEKKFLIEQLGTIGEYSFISNNDKYKDLQQETR